MSLVVFRSTFGRSGTIRSILGASVNPGTATSPNKIQVATLVQTLGGKYPYEEPYPYETKKFGQFSEFFDLTKPRICENSKIITVDGNLAVGKNEFAKRLAKEFDLKYIPSVPDSECFRLRHNNFDLRKLNEHLPLRCQMYDWENFLKEKDLKRGFVGRLQLQWYREKFETYALALHHLLSTGQGCVIVRSVYSDYVFAEALKRCGYVTKNYMKYYNMYNDNSRCELLRPHLSIYLDADMDVIKEKMQERGNEVELNSPAISDQFIHAIDDVYKNDFIPKMRRTGEVLEIDWNEVADDLDMDAVAAEIATMRLDGEDVMDHRFMDWYKLGEDTMAFYRRKFGSNQFLIEYFNRAPPVDCPEILYDAEDYPLLQRLVEENPAVKYNVGTAVEYGHSRFSLT